jgi:glutathione S-transferase
MKIYDFRAGAPSPRKVRTFLAEKGIEVHYQEVDIHKRQSRTPLFKQKNPLGSVPVLELDDGTCIAESTAICRYFESIQPEPALFGATAVEQGLVEMWLRRVETNLYIPIELAGMFRESHPPAAAQYERATLWLLKLLDEVLADREFIALEHYTAPDAFALCSIDFGTRYMDVVVPEELENFARWHNAVSSRESARA